MKLAKFGIVASLVATAGLFAGSATSTAQDAELPGVVDLSRVQAGSYQLDPAHTLVSWQVDHFGFNDYFGLFGNITGTMELDPADVESASFDITVPIAEVTVASEGLREHLFRPGKDGADPDFFGPSPEPARFTSTSVRRTSETTAVVSGMLAMNGETHPVTLLVEFSGAGSNPFSQAQTVGFHARAIIDRTQWGIEYAVPMVGKDVTLEITAAFERQ